MCIWEHSKPRAKLPLCALQLALALRPMCSSHHMRIKSIVTFFLFQAGLGCDSALWNVSCCCCCFLSSLRYWKLSSSSLSLCCFWKESDSLQCLERFLETLHVIIRCFELLSRDMTSSSPKLIPGFWRCYLLTGMLDWSSGFWYGHMWQAHTACFPKGEVRTCLRASCLSTSCQTLWCFLLYNVFFTGHRL